MTLAAVADPGSILRPADLERCTNDLKTLIEREKRLPRYNDGIVRGFDDWSNSRAYVEVVPFSKNDTDDPARYPELAKQNVDDYLRKVHARAPYYRVEVATKSGAVYQGRVRQHRNGAIQIMDESGGLKAIPVSEVDPEKVVLIRDDYSSPLLKQNPDATPSELAMEQGILYAKHSAGDLNVLLDRLEAGEMTPIFPEGNQFRTGNYVELVARGLPELMMYTPKYVMVFNLKILDQGEYLVNPYQNFGTPTSRTAWHNQLPDLAAVFFEIGGKHGGISTHPGNEVVYRTNLSMDYLDHVYVCPRHEKEFFDRVAARGAKPPPGRTWDEMVIVSEKMPTEQLPGE